ncbi:MAG: class I SAM-dependent methyltransferase [Phycisphaerales bacterium]|nr:class I SAM-dependent methyltransferase [Phycisphaerales bacterium]
MPESRAEAREGSSRAGRLAARVRVMLGLRRTFTVDGVRYTERSTEPLRRSLSRKGAGLKEYDAVFTDGVKLRLHCTPARVYADLSGAALLPRYRMVEDLLSPGMRVLEVSCGTGYGAAWLLERVGPSGAVVALDRDRESVKYAQRRYSGANAAFELGGVETLYGELAGGFDAVLAMRGLDSQSGLEATLRELWRVVSPGGWLLVAEPIEATVEGAESLETVLRRVTSEPSARPEASAEGEAAGPVNPSESALISKMDDPGQRPLWLAMKASA